MRNSDTAQAVGSSPERTYSSSTSGTTGITASCAIMYTRYPANNIDVELVRHICDQAYLLYSRAVPANTH